MLNNILLGLGVMILCLLLQIVPLLLALRTYSRHAHWIAQPRLGSGLLVLAMVMLILVAGNLAQIAIWAALFRHLGEFPDFAEAFYHSAVNFATLGYGDLVMSPAHRLLGPIEAINGVLMIGISTSAFMTVLQGAFRQAREHRDAA